jgi:ketosteroid isomerase-like protein
MHRDIAIESLSRLHAAQGTFYAGGPAAPLRELLTDDIVWRIPERTRSPAFNTGIDAVMGYFARRRDLAARTFRMHPGELLVGEGEHAAVLTDGTALLHGVEQSWSTVGLYRFRGDRIAACWLLPLDTGRFDRIWAATAAPARSR